MAKDTEPVALMLLECPSGYLFLRRAAHKSSPGKWSPPGGHIERESDISAAIRELREEAGVVVGDAASVGMFLLGKFRVHLFHKKLDSDPEVKVSDEHSAYAFVSRSEMAIHAAGIPASRGSDSGRKPQMLSDYTAVGQHIVTKYLISQNAPFANAVKMTVKIP